MQPFQTLALVNQGNKLGTDLQQSMMFAAALFISCAHGVM
jgi:hypothetical protein